MTINLELIDELRKRTNVSYSDANEALEKSGGDILQAIVYLEKENKFKQESQQKENSKCCTGFMSKMKSLLHKGNTTRLIMFKKDRVIFSVSATIAVIIGIIGIHILIPAILIALITGHRFRIEGTDANISKVNDTLDKVSDAVDKVKIKLTKDDTDSSDANK